MFFTCVCGSGVGAMVVEFLFCLRKGSCSFCWVFFFLLGKETWCFGWAVLLWFREGEVVLLLGSFTMV